MNTAADCTCSAKHELAFELVSEILHARVDSSDIASFDGVVLGSFVAHVRGIRFYDFGVSGACRGESVVVGRRPDNVHDLNCLDVTLVRGGYLLGHLEALMAAHLSPMIRYLYVVVSGSVSFLLPRVASVVMTLVVTILHRSIVSNAYSCG